MSFNERYYGIGADAVETPLATAPSGATLPFSVFLPDSSWKQDEVIAVTAENQDQFANGLGSGLCSLTPQVTRLESYGDPAMYAPPVGWWVVLISKSDGTQDQLWVGPNGSPATQVGPCASVEGSYDASGNTRPIAPASSGGGGGGPTTAGVSFLTVALLLGGGYMFYKLFSGKSMTTVKARPARAIARKPRVKAARRRKAR